MRAHLASFLFAAATVVASPAFAQDAAEPAPEPAAAVTSVGAVEVREPVKRTPVFSLLHDTQPGAHAVIEASYLDFIDDAVNGGLNARFAGQYLGAGGFGGYGSISGSTLASDNGAGLTSLGNLELGGLYRRAALIPGLDLGARLGVVLPTGDGDLGMASQAVATSFVRPSDIVTAIRDTTAVRLGASPSFRKGQLFAQADIGVDVPVDEADDLDVHVVGHSNFGVGIGTGRVAATAELQNVIDFQAGEGAQRFVHTAGATVQFHVEQSTAYVSVSTPLDAFGRGDVYAVTLGLHVGI